jgi:hypothetical protein
MDAWDGVGFGRGSRGRAALRVARFQVSAWAETLVGRKVWTPAQASLRKRPCEPNVRFHP